jgi:hypothetical protein
VSGWPKTIMQVGPCILAGVQLQTAAVGPTSGPTSRPFSLATLIAQSDLSLAGSIFIYGCSMAVLNDHLAGCLT